MSGFTAIVFDTDPRRPWLAERSARSVRRAGAGEVVTVDVDAELPTFDPPALFLRAGFWLRDAMKTLVPPPASATGRPVIAVGIPPRGPWRELHERYGGDFSREHNLPPIAAAWSCSLSHWERVRVRAASTSNRDHHAEQHALTLTLSRREPEEMRIVHWPAIDVESFEDADRLRVVQVVTSIQQGGAERVTWDLNELLPGLGVDSLLIALGRATRTPLPAPANLVDLSGVASERRADAVAEIAARFGADAIHAHLVRAYDAQRIASDGVPLVVTAHNTRQGWTDGLERIGAALTVACSRAVERELVEAIPASPTRTVWNGIDIGAFARVESNRVAGALTLVCVANPRPQKRLDRLPAALSEVRKTRGDARLVVCGELPNGADDPGGARAALDEMFAEAKRLGVERFVEFTDGRVDVRDALAAADVFVSLSAHEGLSLAQLESLAAGVPVVTTDVGGASEVARGNPAVTILPVDVTPEQTADAILAASAKRSDPSMIRANFSRERMADRYAWLYRVGVHGPRAGGETLWFVANNLSVGGAQSSLRRLVKSLHARGHSVRVAVLQEYEAHPTPGREDLLRTGVPFTVLPPAGTLDVAEAVELLVAEMRAAPPRAVTFWNAILSYKLLLADALLRVPVFDVSPGEMLYDAMDAYFANPRGGLPYRTRREYGERLAGVVVKYAAEADRARATLGAPVHVIPNGVPLPPARTRAGGGDRFVIGTATRLHPHKRVDDLLQAFRIALPNLPPNSVLKIAGGADAGCDDYVERLRAGAADLPVEWLGEVTDVGAFHATLDVFAMISEPAGCPNASLEAMAAGLPIVATDVGGAREQVVDGLNGRLVPPRDAHALAEALVQLGTCGGCRERFGNASRDRAADKFGIGRMTDAYSELFLGAARVRRPNGREHQNQ